MDSGFAAQALRRYLGARRPEGGRLFSRSAGAGAFDGPVVAAGPARMTSVADERPREETGPTTARDGDVAVLYRPFAQQLVVDRVDQRLEGRVDDIGRNADRRPAFALAVGAFDEHARHRVGAALKHAHAIIDEPHVLDKALIGAKILAQREIERVDRAIAFGGGNAALAIAR